MQKQLGFVVTSIMFASMANASFMILRKAVHFVP